MNARFPLTSQGSSVIVMNKELFSCLFVLRFSSCSLVYTFCSQLFSDRELQKAESGVWVQPVLQLRWHFRLSHDFLIDFYSMTVWVCFLLWGLLLQSWHMIPRTVPAAVCADAASLRQQQMLRLVLHSLWAPCRRETEHILRIEEGEAECLKRPNDCSDCKNLTDIYFTTLKMFFRWN